MNLPPPSKQKSPAPKWLTIRIKIILSECGSLQFVRQLVKQAVSETFFVVNILPCLHPTITVHRLIILPVVHSYPPKVQFLARKKKVIFLCVHHSCSSCFCALPTSLFCSKFYIWTPYYRQESTTWFILLIKQKYFFQKVLLSHLLSLKVLPDSSKKVGSETKNLQNIDIILYG